MIVVNALVAIVSVLWLWYVWSRRKFYWLSYKMPGELGLPFIGMAYKRPRAINGGVFKLFKDLEDRHGSVFITWLGPLPFLVVTDPELIEKILTSPRFINKSSFYDVIKFGIGDGVLTSSNPKWSAHRRILAPAFSHKILLNFFPIFNREVGVLLERIDELVGKEEETNIKPYLQRTVFEIVAQTTMGTNMMLTPDENANLMKTVNNMIKLGTRLIMRPWLIIDAKFHITNLAQKMSITRGSYKSFVEKLIKSKFETEKNEKSEGLDKNNNFFIDIAIEKMQSGEFTINDVIEESNIMVFAAYETTVCTLFTTLSCLAIHPEYQELVFEEVKSVLGDKSSPVTYEDLQKLVYTEMVINETMRLFSPVPLISRVLDADTCIHKDIVFPKGLQVAIDIYNLQRDERLWGPRAKQFDPDHFLPSNLATKHPYAFIPFSKGQRNCLGSRYSIMSLKLLLAKIIRNYKLSTPLKLEDFQAKYGITLKFKSTPKFHIERRS